LYLFDYEETLNMKVVIDKLTFSEWIKPLNFDVEISSYDHCKLELNSDLKRELMGHEIKSLWLSKNLGKNILSGN